MKDKECRFCKHLFTCKGDKKEADKLCLWFEDRRTQEDMRNIYGEEKTNERV